MSDYTIGNGTIKNIANAIRAQEGSSGTISVADFASRVAALTPRGPVTGDISNVNTKYYGVNASTISALGNALKEQDGLTGPVSGFAQRILDLVRGTRILGDVVVPYLPNSWFYTYTQVSTKRDSTVSFPIGNSYTMQDIKDALANVGIYYKNIDDYEVGTCRMDYMPYSLTRVSERAGSTSSLLLLSSGHGSHPSTAGVGLSSDFERIRIYGGSRDSDSSTLTYTGNSDSAYPTRYFLSISFPVLYKTGTLSKVKFKTSLLHSTVSYNDLIANLYDNNQQILPMLMWNCTDAHGAYSSPLSLDFTTTDRIVYNKTNNQGVFAIPFEEKIGPPIYEWETEHTIYVSPIDVPQQSIVRTGTDIITQNYYRLSYLCVEEE